MIDSFVHSSGFDFSSDCIISQYRSVCTGLVTEAGLWHGEDRCPYPPEEAKPETIVAGSVLQRVSQSAGMSATCSLS
jgi:hypothetical protein